MSKAFPPWQGPAAVRVCGGGSDGTTHRQTIGNNGTQSQRLQEAFPLLRSFGCTATQEKSWKRKA